MNVDQLFTKRKADTDIDDGISNSKISRNTNSNDLKILEAIKRDDAHLNFEIEKYDSTWLSKTLIRVDRAIIANSEMRAKYKDDPSKFLDSEFELNESIKVLSGLSLVEDESVIEEFCENKTTMSLIALMKTHPNLDISNQLVSIIGELVDKENDEELDVIKAPLSRLFIKTKFTYLLCDHIIKLEDKAKDVLLKDSIKMDILESNSTALELLIKLAEFSELNKFLIDDKKLIKFVLSKINIESSSDVDEMLQSYSELITSLVSETANIKISRITKLLQNYNIVELLLINVSKFINKKKLDTVEIEEYVENVIDTLCYLFNISPLAKTQFLENEGLELLFMILSKDNKWAIARSFKLLANLINTNDEVSLKIAPAIITNGGLKYLFKSLRNHQVIRIIASLFRLLELDSNERIRLYNKFIDKENHYFKKVLQLREKYANDMDDEEDDPTEAVNLQQLNLIISWCLIDENFRPRFDNLVPHDVKVGVKENLETQTEELEQILEENKEQLEDVHTLNGMSLVNSRETIDMLKVLLANFK